MSAGWIKKSLGDIAVIGAGNSAPQDKALFSGGKYPFFRTSDVGRIHVGTLIDSEDKLNENGIRRLTLHPAGTILIPKSGASTFLDHRVIMGVDGYVSSHLATIRAKPEVVDTKYLFYYLLTVAARTLGVDTGYPTLSLSQVNGIKVVFPGLSEQHRIVSILDEALDGLATATANAEKNCKNTRELFESYLNSVFRKKGENWTEKILGDVCRFQGGAQPPKAKFSKDQKDGYVRLIQIRDYKSDKFAVYIPKALTKKFCAADDVMIGRYGPPLFQILRGLDGAYNVALMKAMPDDRILSKDFLFYFLKNNDILSYIIRSSSRAAGQSGLNKETIEPYPIAFPSLHRQAEIVKSLRETEEECKRLEANYKGRLVALADLKQSILQKAFSGELTSPPSQAIKEAAE